MKLYVGTSGYSYKEWKGSFYPEEIKPDKMLEFYSEQFSTVEINNTFYRVPQRSVLETWRQQVPEDFRFSIKAPQRITHMKKLKDVDEDIRYFIDIIISLGNKLGIVLFQFPPYFRKNLELLKNFTNLLPKNITAAFEFRHESWFGDDLYSFLNEKSFPLCLSETDKEPDIGITGTASKGYLRLRKSDYSKKEIKNWHDKIKRQNWETVFVFFRHEDEAKGPKFARQLIDLQKG
ncbi:MAG: DUF72 domain-containing protein [Ignavibacteriaceae bacterium]